MERNIYGCNSTGFNVSDGLKIETPLIGPEKPNVADALFDRDLRLVVLTIIIIIGSMGGAVVCVWLCFNWTKRSRVHYVICNVTASDMLVLNVTCVIQLVWEWFDRRWIAGNVGCKLAKTFQGFSLMSSNFMVVVLTFDRFQAVVHPLKPLCKTKRLTALGWLAGFLLSCPQLFVFREHHVTSGGPFQNKTVCESNFRSWPRWARQVYLTSISCIVFYVPFVVIILCYFAVYMETTKQSGKYSTTGDGRRGLGLTFSRERRPGDGSVEAGRKDETRKSREMLIWSSQRAKSFALARMKTLKMAVVVSLCFLVCVAPYHLLETWMSFGDHTAIHPSLMAVLGSLAVLHSAINPYLFLAFNIAKGNKGFRRRCRGLDARKEDALSDFRGKRNSKRCLDQEVTVREGGRSKPGDKRTIISTDLSIKITTTSQFLDI